MRFINLHTHKFSGDAAVLELVNQYPNEFTSEIPFYSIGIHPWHISQDRLSDDLRVIEEKMSDKNCLAIGECGLDKRIETPLSLQTQVFESQLALAEQYKKPAIIHCVAAYAEIIAVKRRLQISVPLVIHGFSKKIETANQLLDNGFYLSFGKYLLQNPELESVFQSVPNDRFFLETDTIEQAIQEVYTRAAEYKNVSLAEMKQLTATTFTTVFNRTI